MGKTVATGEKAPVAAAAMLILGSPVRFAPECAGEDTQESIVTQLSRRFGDVCGGIGWVLRQEGSYLLFLLLVAAGKGDEVFLLVLLSLTARHDDDELERVSIGKNRGYLGRRGVILMAVRWEADGGMERGRKRGRL